MINYWSVYFIVCCNRKRDELQVISITITFEVSLNSVFLVIFVKMHSTRMHSGRICVPAASGAASGSEGGASGLGVKITPSLTPLSHSCLYTNNPSITPPITHIRSVTTPTNPSSCQTPNCHAPITHTPAHTLYLHTPCHTHPSHTRHTHLSHSYDNPMSHPPPTNCMLGYTAPHPLCGQNDWRTCVKHYLPAASFAGGNELYLTKTAVYVNVLN